MNNPRKPNHSFSLKLGPFHIEAINLGILAAVVAVVLFFGERILALVIQ